MHHRQIGRLFALEKAPGIKSDLSEHLCDRGSVAHQAAGFDVFTHGIDRGDAVARGEGGKLDAPRVVECVGCDEDSLEALPRQRCERRVYLALRAGIEDLDLQRQRASGGFDLSDRVLGIGRIGGIDEHGNASGLRHHLVQEPEALSDHFSSEEVHARRVAAGASKARDEAQRDRVFGNAEDDRDRRSRRFGRQTRARVARCRNHADPTRHEIGR